ncbi:MAG: ABC transporter permease subunit [Clostridiales bacterium]|nr:ABC transporter permease subunit [Clostridiales bacterium]
MSDNAKNNAKKILKRIIIAAFWLGAWQILSAVVGLEVLLPSPVSVVKALADEASTADFWLSVLYSIIRISIGFLLGTVLGTVTAVISAASKMFTEFLSPIIHIIKATPVASFIILAVVWIKTNNVPSFISMLIVFPVIWMNVKTGISETDKELLEMSDAFGVKRSKKIAKIYIPSVKPYFISGASTAMGLAWKSGVAAEVICNPTLSLGSGIYDSKIYLETPNLFAWTAVVIILSIVLEKIMLLLINRGKSK